ncbi:putative UDP-glucuronate 4-epimerase [Helianthus annuus]|nr:putative UDP-glucuronate 4-epimerase [Helianthus annuus]
MWRFGADLRLLICLEHQMMDLGTRMGKTVNSSANIRSKTGYSVLVTVTGAAGFVGTHISAILKRHDDCVLGLDNFNNYYDPTLEGLVKFCWKKVGFLLWKGT